MERDGEGKSSVGVELHNAPPVGLQPTHIKTYSNKHIDISGLETETYAHPDTLSHASERPDPHGF